MTDPFFVETESQSSPFLFLTSSTAEPSVFIPTLMFLKRPGLERLPNSSKWLFALSRRR